MSRCMVSGKSILLLCVIVALASCSRAPEAPRRVVPSVYVKDLASQVTLRTFDAYGTQIAEVRATYVVGDIVVAPLSAIRGAVSAKMLLPDGQTMVPVHGYTAFDFAHDLVTLRVGKRNDKFAPRDTSYVSARDTLFGVFGSVDGKIFKKPVRNADYSLCAAGLNCRMAPGSGVFDKSGALRAIVGSDSCLIVASVVDSIVAHMPIRHTNIYDLRLHTGRTYISASKVASIMFRTTMGNFSIRLFDDVPDYRDNFIKLVSDGYYDSLLVHRVLPSFLIQTGAADTKYAGKDDVVGWQGPGYNLPNVEHPKHFHKRGAVAASKLPPDRNPSNKSDGGQFYVVCGRVASSAELDKIEKDNYYKFSQAQRDAYMSVGGAPHLDSEFVVFGEVVSGMDVVDRISRVAVDVDRPVKDVRVLSARIVKKESAPVAKK